MLHNRNFDACSYPLGLGYTVCIGEQHIVRTSEHNVTTSYTRPAGSTMPHKGKGVGSGLGHGRHWVGNVVRQPPLYCVG